MAGIQNKKCFKEITQVQFFCFIGEETDVQNVFDLTFEISAK